MQELKEELHNMGITMKDQRTVTKSCKVSNCPNTRVKLVRNSRMAPPHQAMSDAPLTRRYDTTTARPTAEPDMCERFMAERLSPVHMRRTRDRARETSASFGTKRPGFGCPTRARDNQMGRVILKITKFLKGQTASGEVVMDIETDKRSSNPLLELTHCTHSCRSPLIISYSGNRLSKSPQMSEISPHSVSRDFPMREIAAETSHSTSGIAVNPKITSLIGSSRSTKHSGIAASSYSRSFAKAISSNL